ncbi:hypothetical protein ACFLYB_00400 [Chloroflexota bacterium]
MKLAGVIGSFTISLALFILAYFTLENGYVGFLFGTGGFILAITGTFIAMSKSDDCQYKHMINTN